MQAEKATVALVQARPFLNDLPATVEKAVDLISQASRSGAKVVVFGETFLSGYPAWLDHSAGAALWDHEPSRRVYAQMRQNSVTIPGRWTEILGKAARDNHVNVVMGLNERVDRGVGSGTLYNSLITFDRSGKLINHHRKLVPTFTERMVHGNGDGDGLAVVDTSSGRIGGLICWEHWMPLARQAMHNAGEQIHAAVFPTVHEMHQITCRQYAFEGRCFVLAVGSILLARDLPADLGPAEDLDPDAFLLRGGSCVIGPDGRFVTEPVFDTETIIISELDLTLIDREKMTLDVSGHYSRLDIFEFSVRRGSRNSRS